MWCAWTRKPTTRAQTTREGGESPGGASAGDLAVRGACPTTQKGLLWNGRETVPQQAKKPVGARAASAERCVGRERAAAVYNRLFIYIDFNGMTRMRVVGLLGISAVLGGFVLVVWKILRQRGFFWLMQRQLWVLALMVFLGAVLPVDLLVHRYNVSRIMAGDSAHVCRSACIRSLPRAC